MSGQLPGMDYIPIRYRGELVDVPIDNAREMIRRGFARQLCDYLKTGYFIDPLDEPFIRPTPTRNDHENS